MPNNPPENPQENAAAPGLQLPNLQQHINTKLSVEQLEKLRKGGSMRGLFESLFGENTPAANFLTNVTNWITRRLGVQVDEPISDEEFFGAIDKQAAAAIQSGIIAHRGLGYQFNHPNTAKGIEAALASGEQEVEFDLRIGPDGRVMVRHDPFDGTHPEEGQTSFEEALAIFHRYPSARLFIDIKGGRQTVSQIVACMQTADKTASGSPNYRSVFSRSALMMFNPDALAAARELAPNCPVIFHYFPTGGFTTLNNTILPAYQNGLISHSQLTGALSVVDRLTGNTNLASGFRNTSLHVNEQNPFSATGTSPSEERITTYSMLPPQAILNMVRASGGAISVPWPLVRDWPQFFLAVRQSGVRLAVFGFEDPNRVGNSPEQAAAAVKQHNQEMRRAIALGANMIITDHPNAFAAH